MGFLLIALGVLALAGQLGFLEGVGILYILSLAFLGLYVFVGGRSQYGNVGWLIPGLVLLAVGIAVHSEDIPGRIQLPEGSILFLMPPLSLRCTLFTPELPALIGPVVIGPFSLPAYSYLLGSSITPAFLATSPM